MNFNFETIKVIQTEDTENTYLKHTFVIFREVSTDTLFVDHDGTLAQMLDPDTGKPLTYKVWKEKYKE